MSNTIDDFTNFYKKDKQKEHFLISQVINNATTIIFPTLKSNKVDLNIIINKDFELNSYPKELAQVLLNLLQNSKDAIFLNNIENPKIEVIVNEKEIIVKDNANGIQEDVLNKIFEPYFTTKEKHKGTGLGLYMSRMILEKNINATITGTNIEKSAVFTIVFK
jgi:C4-dicarboxylate-specific signal transduction histidine kinase